MTKFTQNSIKADSEKTAAIAANKRSIEVQEISFIVEMFLCVNVLLHL